MPRGAGGRLRFIPACAGNAARRSRLSPSRAVHPRMRGERLIMVGLRGSPSGSSPHARGTRMRERERWRFSRFIPACAGNASRARTDQPKHSVHPRMRGERSTHHAMIHDSSGSSPHARGTLSYRYLCTTYSRFIPACAGNAVAGSISNRVATVHPRMRGERNMQNRSAPSEAGSSPHARGTPGPCPAATANYRFIPACAGNAARAICARATCAVHPRMRGERRCQLIVHRRRFGSSPHARGTRG